MTIKLMFMKDGVSRVAIIRDILSSEHGTHTPANRAFAVELMKLLPPEELMELVPELVMLASWLHKYTLFVQQLIQSLPRTWILENLPQYVEKYLTEDNEEEWGAFLRLYSLLDRQMTLELAHRAMRHPNSEVRTLGDETLDGLN